MVQSLGNLIKVDDLLVDKPRCGRPKVLYSVARKLVKKLITDEDMHGLRRLVKQLKACGGAGGKDAIRDCMSKELKWKNWWRKTQSVVI